MSHHANSIIFDMYRSLSSCMCCRLFLVWVLAAPDEVYARMTSPEDMPACRCCPLSSEHLYGQLDMGWLVRKHCLMSAMSGGRGSCQAVGGSRSMAFMAECDAAAGAQHRHVRQQPRPVVHQHLQHPALILHASLVPLDSPLYTTTRPSRRSVHQLAQAQDSFLKWRALEEHRRVAHCLTVCRTCR